MDGLLSFVIILAGIAMIVIGINDAIDFFTSKLEKNWKRPAFKFAIGLIMILVGGLMLNFSTFGV
jgi:uncharacterized membrane protein HdeD (DUF308 family)